VLDRFLGASWHAQEAGILDAVEALIERGDVDPVAIRAVSWTLCDVTPFYCPECELNYCSGDWDISVDFNVGFYDCILASARTGIGTSSADWPSCGFSWICDLDADRERDRRV